MAVTNNLETDQRVHKIALTLQDIGLEPLVVGRKFANSTNLIRPYQTHRFHLFFNKKALFYATYNIRLFLFLLKKRAQNIVANDMDTLPACYFAAKITHAHLVFDAHEIFSELPEVVGRKSVQKVWKTLERFFIPKLQTCYTVNNSLANFYKEKYAKKFEVVYNFPLCNSPKEKVTCKLPEHPENGHKVIIYQGAVNKDRGLEQLIDAMPLVEHAVLWIVGGGDVLMQLKRRAKKLNLNKKVVFIGQVSFEKLHFFTQNAHVGVSLEQNTNLNYYFSLPNKIFDYLHAGLPVLVSPLPEMKKIVTQNKVGELVESFDKQLLAQQINALCTNQNAIDTYRQNISNHANDFCWENQRKIIQTIYKKV